MAAELRAQGLVQPLPQLRLCGNARKLMPQERPGSHAHRVAAKLVILERSPAHAYERCRLSPIETGSAASPADFRCGRPLLHIEHARMIRAVRVVVGKRPS